MKQEISNKFAHVLNCKSIFSCRSNILQTDCHKKRLTNYYPPLVIWLLNRKVMLSPDVQKIYFPDRAETNFAPENFGIISVNPKFWEFLQVQTPY